MRRRGAHRDERGWRRGGHQEITIVKPAKLVRIAVRWRGGYIRIEMVHARRGAQSGAVSCELGQIDEVAALDCAHNAVSDFFGIINKFKLLLFDN